MSGPMVMLGTKRPSITSTWIQSAPAASQARTSSARRPKSAERIEGAISVGIDAIRSTRRGGGSTRARSLRVALEIQIEQERCAGDGQQARGFAANLEA